MTTDVRDGAEVEDVRHAEIELFGVRTHVLQPVGPVKIDVLDQQRIERVHVSHQDLIMLSTRTHTHTHKQKTVVIAVAWLRHPPDKAWATTATL